MKSTGRPKPKKISKHKKKGWKTIDSTALEDFLDERSFEERTGGTISDKSNSELFFIDKQVDLTTTDGEKPNRRNKKLRCFSILEPDPRIKAVNLGKSSKSQNIKRLHPDMKKRKIDKEEKLFEAELNKFHTRNLRQRKYRKNAPNLLVKDYDLWKDLSDTPKEGEDHILDVTITKPVKPPKNHYKKPSAVPAVTDPHPGMSYNPTYGDHQNLLGKALRVELKKKKDEEKIQKETVLKKIEVEEKVKNKEVKKDKDETSEEDEEMSDEDLMSTGLNPAVRREDKKSYKQKQHDWKVKIRARQKNALKSRRIRESEVYRIKTFNKEFKEKEQITKKRMKKKQRLEKREVFKTKRLGHAKFEDADIDLQLGKELSGSLRKLKPEGNIMSDRYKSYQKRNIIPAPAGIQKRKLAHVKFYEKRGHREIS
ncbi:hypothetical protein SNE40_009269 [Patella caerulea]